MFFEICVCFCYRYVRHFICHTPANDQHRHAEYHPHPPLSHAWPEVRGKQASAPSDDQHGSNPWIHTRHLQEAKSQWFLITNYQLSELLYKLIFHWSYLGYTHLIIKIWIFSYAIILLYIPMWEISCCRIANFS